MKVVIVDDEKQSHNILNTLLAKFHPDLETLGSGFNVAEGVDLVNRLNPDLIFLDIQMPDGLGFDLLTQINPNRKFQVIFITAHNGYALPAIQAGALAYLLKPLNSEDLSGAIEKAKKQYELESIKVQLEILQETLENMKEDKPPKRMSISTLKGIKFIFMDDIIRFEAQGSYTFIYLNSSGQRILASNNIGEYNKMLVRNSSFMKVQRSHLINLNFVDSFVSTDGGYAEMLDNAQVPVSPKYREELKRRMKTI